MTGRGNSGFLLGRHVEETLSGQVGFHTVARAPSQGAGYVFDSDDGHAMLFAPTGAGKKRHILGPTLLSSEDPAIVIDVKGELALETADYRRRVLGHQVVIIDPWRIVTNHGAGFNPLDIVTRDPSETADDAASLSQLLIDGDAPLKEIYWDDRASAIIAGLIEHVVCGEAEDDRSFRRVWNLAHGDDTIYQLAVLLDTQKVAPFARAQIAGLLSLSADQTRSCILSVMHQHLRVFGSQAVQQATAKTSFSLDAVRAGEPLTIYFVIPPHRLRSHATLLRVWLAALIMSINQRKTPPKRPTLLMVDEAAQIGRMSQLTQSITLSRSYGLRCMLVWQSAAQLHGAYAADAATLVENSSTLATFGHTAFSMSEKMADTFGDIAASQLFNMAGDELAIRTRSQRTKIIKRADYISDPELRGRASPNPMFSGQGALGRQAGLAVASQRDQER